MGGDNTSRFTHRVADYERWRPSYPPEVLPVLRRELGLEPGHDVVDLGSGTGISARLFLEAGHRVYGVEPNAAMRGAAERALSASPAFTSVDGTAEVTHLPSACADLACAAQALHWFDPERTRAELERVLRPPRRVVLMWNTWHQEDSPFMREYREVIHTFALDAGALRRHEDTRLFAPVPTLLGPRAVLHELPNAQVLDLDGLLGRARSASYVPPLDHPTYPAFAARLGEVFERHARGGLVELVMKTRVFTGHLVTSPASSGAGR